MIETDPCQQRATECETGPQLILAGPGTGKTTALIAHFTDLVKQGIEPQRILAITLTRKAGEEMKNRLKPLINRDSSQLNVETFHTLADKILREYAHHVGLNQDFQVLNEQTQEALLRSLNLFWNSESGKHLPEFFAEVKARMLDAAGFAKELTAELRAGGVRQNDPLFEATEHMALYEKELLARNTCDLEDLIAHTVRILEKEETIRQVVAQQFDYLLVDEFQDVSPAQYRLLRALLLEHQNLWVVGDDDQSIFSSRGADLTYTTHFRKLFPNAQLKYLETNYRSSQQILHMAEQLIGFNKKRQRKVMRSISGSGSPVVALDFPNPEDEAAWIVDAIGNVLEKGVAHREIAVLFRMHHQAFPLQLAFQKNKIPIVLHGTEAFWELAPARYLRGLLLYAMNQQVPKAKALLAEGDVNNRLTRFARFLDVKEYSRIVKELRDKLISDPPHFYKESQNADWADQVHVAAQIALSAGSIVALETRVSEQAEFLQGNESDAVCLSTIHEAKGQEWHTVFLAGFEADLLPYKLAVNNWQEERRLAYVALSRAKRYLCMSYCLKRHRKRSGPSPFLGELLLAVDPANYVWGGSGNGPSTVNAAATFSATTATLNAITHWTTEEDCRLIQLANAGSTLKEIAMTLGRTITMVSYRLRLLEEEKPYPGMPELIQPKSWTARDDRKIASLWKQGRSEDEIADQMRRTVTAVKHRLDDLNLTGESPEQEADSWRDKLIKIALVSMKYDEALAWMRAPNSELDLQSPWQLSNTASGFKKAALLLEKPE